MNSIYEITYILSLIYGFILSYFKYKYRAKSHSFKIKNTENVDNLRKEIEKLDCDDTSTTHIYKDDLSKEMQYYIDKLSFEVNKEIGDNYINIPEITEIYYTARKTKNSDTSFTSLHTDSPFHFCNTYRALICIEPCKSVTTIIPRDNIEVNLDKYDVLAFDYANTLHYINIDESKRKNRIVVKLHYASSPISYILTKRYTRWARSLYVNNLKKMQLTGEIMLYTQFVTTNVNYVVTSGILLHLINIYLRWMLIKYFMSIYIILAIYNINFQVYFMYNNF